MSKDYGYNMDIKCLTYNKINHEIMKTIVFLFFIFLTLTMSIYQ